MGNVVYSSAVSLEEMAEVTAIPSTLVQAYGEVIPTEEFVKEIGPADQETGAVATMTSPEFE